MTGRLQSRTSSHRTFPDHLKRVIVSRHLTNHGECECGEPSRDGSGLCSRCAFLDGDDQSMSMMISALRESDGATAYDLADSLGITVRAVLRVIANLKRAGRVRSGHDFMLIKRPSRRWGLGHIGEFWEAKKVAVHFLVERQS